VVFGFDDAVRGGAFAGDVARGGGINYGGMGEGGSEGCGLGEGGTYRSTTSPFSFSMVVVGSEVVWDGFWGGLAVGEGGSSRFGVDFVVLSLNGSLPRPRFGRA